MKMKKHKHKQRNLSQAIEPLDFQNKVLQAASKKITNVDKVSSYVARDITTLDLSSNYILSLSQFNQFVNLTHLNIAKNIVSEGRQLLKLYSLLKLRSVYISGNPFLQDPLDQEVLEFILQKQTDIQILSGQALKAIKQIETGQLKVIFLENYLKKISYHSQLLNKVQKAPKIENQQQQEQQSQQQGTKKDTTNILNKIIPGFYTALQSSELKHQLRKQTVQLKRQHKHNSQITFEQIIEMRKINQERMVQNLINDIILLVEDQNQNTPSKSYSFDNRKFTQSVGKNKFESSFRKIWLKGSPADSRKNDIYHSRISSQSPSNQKSLRLPQSLETTRKLHKASHQSLLKPQISYQIQRLRKKQKQKQENLVLKQKQNFSRTQELRNIPEITQSFSSPTYISVISPKSAQQISGKSQSKVKFKQNNVNQLGNRSMNSSNIELSLQNFQTYYYRNLTKSNPIYQLLYSPFTSLSAQQKTLLLQNLSKNHKQISIQLLRSKKINQQLIQDIRVINNQREAQAQNLIAYCKQSRQFASTKAEQLEQKHTQNLRLSQMLQNVCTKLKILELQSKQKDSVIKANQNEYKRLQQACLASAKKNEQYQCYEQYEEIIEGKKSNSIKKHYYKILLKKAISLSRLKKVQNQKKKRQQWRIKQLIFSGFKRYKLINDYIKIKEKQKCRRCIKLHFKQWAILNKLQKKQLHLINLKKKIIIGQFRTTCKTIKASKQKSKLIKQKGLTDYRLKKMRKMFQIIKSQANKSKTKYNRVDQYIFKKIKQKYFWRLCKLVQEKINKIKSIIQLNNKHKQLHAVLKIKRKIDLYKQIQLKKNQVMKYFYKRHINVFKGSHKILSKKLQKKNKRLLKMIIIIRIKSTLALLRQKNKINKLKKQKNSDQLNLQQHFSNSISRISKRLKNLPAIDYLILLHEKQIHLKWSLTKRNVHAFYNNMRQCFLTNKSLENKKEQLNIIFKSALRNRVSQFLHTLRMKTIHSNQKLRQEAINQQSIKRQREWITRLSSEDSNIQKLILQVSQLHRQITNLKTTNLDCRQEIEQLRTILQHKDKIITSYQQQDFQRFNNRQITDQKYSRLLELYGEAIDALDKKQKDCLWLIEVIQKEQRSKNVDNIISAGNIVEKGNTYMSERVYQHEPKNESQNTNNYESPERKQSDKYKYCTGSTRKKYARNNLPPRKQ